MKYYQSFLLLLLLAAQGCCQQEEVCTKSVINSCGDCIRSGQHCAWCQQLNFTKAGEQDTVRCDTRANLKARGCRSEQIISPTNDLRVTANKELSQKFQGQEPVQMKPQSLHLTLRPGLSTNFTVSFKRAEGYPVDLYYLMDLSYSMKDDLANVKLLGRELLAALNKITEDARIGFGAFVDKTVLPYTNTNKEKLLKPCDENEQRCQAAFGYRHVLSMTNSEKEFRDKVSEQFISGNLDSPEGSLDAMMQAAICGDVIGWRNSSTRLIVLTTDAGFHMAGDGKLAGILEPNDRRCHMTNGLYSRSSLMDYPSVGQLAMELKRKNIQPIFAVTQNVEKVYQELSRMIPKSEVGVLTSNSDNVVSLIDSAYKRLSSKVILSHNQLPNGVRLFYKPNCPSAGSSGESEGSCENVHVGQEISFEVTVTADSCLDQQQSFTIRPQGIRDTLTVTLSTRCECHCENPTDPQHTHCHSAGSVDCGICRCMEGHLGQFCECSAGTKDEQELQAFCRKDNGTVCEGRGDCECGRCKCHTLENQASYYGDFCQCDDFHCEMFQNKLCGGNGDCNCGTCKCFPGFEGSACECRVSDEECRTPENSVCYGRGTCKCNRCKCKDGYQKPHCQTCLSCPNQCLAKLECVECRFFNEEPSKNCSRVCSGRLEGALVEQFSIPGNTACYQKDSQGCWIRFRLLQLVGEDNYQVEVDKRRECPEPPNVVAIILGSLGAVAVIGFLLLLLVKLLIHMKDLKEFRKFENEKKKSKWAEADNPLFKNATTTVANPTFTGE